MDLMDQIRSVQPKIKYIVDKRLEEFQKGKDQDRIFSELCFCILTANFTAERGIRIQDEIGDGFIMLPEKALAKKLKKLGHRFPNARACYIANARPLRKKLSLCLSIKKEDEIRDWLVQHIKGIGYKEASHFMRNIGFENIAIIDFHIIDVLVKNKLIDKPKTLTKAKYMEIEQVLKDIGGQLHMTLAELDLHMWYLETGKVLK